MATATDASDIDIAPSKEEWQLHVADNLQLLKTGKFSDLKVRCGGHEWLAHRSVLCTGSKFFTKACDGGFKETQSGVIEIKDAEPGIVGRALTYLYTMGYPDVLDSERHQVPASNPNANSGGQVSTTTPTPAANEESKKALDLLLMHARVYSMADRLDISGLRLLSSRKFKKIFEKGPQADFSTAVVEVLRSTPHNDQGLRKTVQKLCAEFLIATTSGHYEGSPIDRANWEAALHEDSGFALDVVFQMTDEHRKRMEEKHEEDYNYLRERTNGLLRAAETRTCPECREDFQPDFYHRDYAPYPFHVELHCYSCSSVIDI